MSIEPNKPFPIAATIPITGTFDEKWLQDQICENPSILTLGELEFFSRERIQWKNGRLDILLKNEDRKRMYEVEVMLGETDEKHVIHTIEYWDNEKRKFPLWQHYPVLVAEKFDTRFFNIMHLFSQQIPLIAIQVNLVEVAGEKCLHFSKIIDVYQEPETEGHIDTGYTEEDWKRDCSWAVEAAKTLLDIIKPVFPNSVLNFVKAYISVQEDGYNLIWIKGRINNKSQIEFCFREKDLPKAMELLVKADIVYITKDNESILVTMDSSSLKLKKDTIFAIAELSKAAWDED